MKQRVEVPSVGESVSKGLLTSWLKGQGDYVREGEELFELETDKATMAIPATASGVLEIVVAADTEVAVGQVVGQIDTEAAARPAAAPPAAAPQAAAAAQPAQRPVQQPAQQPTAALSPAVRRLVEEHDVDTGAIEGSGKGGRLTKGDVLEHLERQAAAAQEAPAAAPQRSVPGRAARQERKRMSPLRRTVAEHMVASRQTAAHLTTFNEVDMSRVMEMRATYREAFEKKHGVRLGFMSFFVKACVAALADWPEVNAQIEGDEIVYNRFYDIGVAVSTERGLVVPVVRDADARSFAAIEKEIADLAVRARDRKLTVEEMSGGTFTITNGGVFGSLLSTPIPNPPQTAVLGMHAIQKRPVVVNDQIVIRPMMYLALTYDHRLIDGRQAVGFLVEVKNLVEDPARLLFEV